MGKAIFATIALICLLIFSASDLPKLLAEMQFKDKPKPVLISDGRYKKALDKACGKYGDYRYYSYCEQLAGE